MWIITDTVDRHPLMASGPRQRRRQTTLRDGFRRAISRARDNPAGMCAVVLSCLFHVLLLTGAVWLSSADPERHILMVHFRQKVFRDQAEALEAEGAAGAGQMMPQALSTAGLPFVPVKDVTIKVPLGTEQSVRMLRQVKERITGLWDVSEPPAGGKVLARMLIARNGRVVSIEVEQLSGAPSLGVYIADLLKQAGGFEQAMEERVSALTVECEFTVTVANG